MGLNSIFFYTGVLMKFCHHCRAPMAWKYQRALTHTDLSLVYPLPILFLKGLYHFFLLFFWKMALQISWFTSLKCDKYCMTEKEQVSRQSSTWPPSYGAKEQPPCHSQTTHNICLVVCGPVTACAVSVNSKAAKQNISSMKKYQSSMHCEWKYPSIIHPWNSTDTQTYTHSQGNMITQKLHYTHKRSTATSQGFVSI